jgi:hypothetical protein
MDLPLSGAARDGNANALAMPLRSGPRPLQRLVRRRSLACPGHEHAEEKTNAETACEVRDSARNGNLGNETRRRNGERQNGEGEKHLGFAGHRLHSRLSTPPDYSFMDPPGPRNRTSSVQVPPRP